MTSLLLPIIKENSDYDLEQTLPIIESKKLDSRYFHICWEAYRSRGIASFLLSCDVNQFYVDLHRSGCSYLYYLKNLVNDSQKSTSFSAPFFDTITSEDWDTAQAISYASRHAHNPNEEYIDDFLYIYYLMKQFFLGGKREELKEILDKFENNLSDDSEFRFKICNALYKSDSEMFHEALLELIILHDDKYNLKYKDGLIPEEEWVVNSFLFIEGLALIKLANSMDLEILHSDYRLMPSIILKKSLPIYDPDDWLKG